MPKNNKFYIYFRKSVLIKQIAKTFKKKNIYRLPLFLNTSSRI